MKTKQFIGLTAVLVIILPWVVRAFLGYGFFDGIDDTIVDISFILLVGLLLVCFAMPGCLTLRKVPRLLGCLLVCFVLSYLVNWLLIRLGLLWGEYFALLFVASILAPLFRAAPYLLSFAFLPKVLGWQPKATRPKRRDLAWLCVLSLVVFSVYEVISIFSLRFSSFAFAQWMYVARGLCLPVVYISVALFPLIQRTKVDAERVEREDVPTS